MLASLLVIGGIGYAFERFVFGSIEGDRAAVGHGAHSQGLENGKHKNGPD